MVEGNALRLRNLEIERLFERIHETVVVAEATTARIVFWNPAAEALFGYTAVEAVGQPVELLVPERLRAPYRMAWERERVERRARLARTGQMYELPVRHKSGAEVYVELTLSLLGPIPVAAPPLAEDLSDGAAPALVGPAPASVGPYVLAIVRDVTARREAEAGLRERAARLQRLHEAALAIAAPVSPQPEAKTALLTTIVAHAVAAVGSMAGRLVVATDEPWRDVVSGTMEIEGHMAVRHTGQVARERLRPEGDVAHVLATGAPVFVEHLDAPSPFGPFPAAKARGVCAFAVVPLRAGGRILGALVVDFARAGVLSSETRETLELFAAHVAAALDRVHLLYLEQQHATERAARAAAETATRARDEFLSVAAHELKTPITSLRGLAQLALRQLDRQGTLDPDRAIRALRMVDEQSGKLTRLVNQLLDVTRLETGRLSLEKQRTDVVALVRGVIAAARLAGQPTHTIVLHAPPMALEVMVDPLRLEQVVMNLLDNARKFAPLGSTIDVEVWRTDTADVADVADVTHGVNGTEALELGTEMDTVRIAVRDRGPGIPVEHRERVFDRFYQINLAGTASGMGLGLAISREIVALHGGRITLEHPSGGGARFVVILPSQPSQAQGS